MEEICKIISIPTDKKTKQALANDIFDVYKSLGGYDGETLPDIEIKSLLEKIKARK